MPFGLLADLVLAAHLAFLLFMLGGQAAIFAGWALGWGWTRNRWFRGLHLAGILFVVLQSWLGVVCPLTDLEHRLRSQVGDPGYERGFISDWLARLLFYSAPDWVFVLLYSLFALLVVISFIAYPPRLKHRSRLWL
jgi:hypothetical protein